MRAINYKNDNFKIKEPFQSLFTQGMVCHETYKDDKNNWISPDEIFSDDGKNYFTIKEKKKLKLVHLSQCQNQKKIQLILKK